MSTETLPAIVAELERLDRGAAEATQTEMVYANREAWQRAAWKHRALLLAAARENEAMRKALERVMALENAKEMRVPEIAKGTGMMGKETPDGFVPLHPMAASAFRTAAAIARAALPPSRSDG